MEKPETVCFTPPAGIRIRPAHSGDESVLYSFVGELEATTLDPLRFRTVFQHNLTNPMVYYFVAEQVAEVEVVGFISCHVQYLLHHTGKVAEIQELFVKPAYRNQQIGRQLVATLYALAIRENFVSLEVTTNQKRTDTVRFYERECFYRTHYKLVKPIQA